MTLGEIAKASGGLFVGTEESKSLPFQGATMDSRQVEPGMMFIAIKGERVDGHYFISQVYEKGASCVLCEKAPEENRGTYIQVPSTLEAIKQIAAYYRRSLSIPVVGISGSVGKTSTKEMIASVLAQKYKVLKTAGNFNNELGLPLTIFGIRPEHEVAVLEMGISDFGEMHRLATMANPDICVITNIGLCHLENLGDRDGVLRAKTEMFDHMTQDGVAILNGDDDKLSLCETVNGAPTIFYGKDGVQGKEIYATEVVNLGFEGMEATIHTPSGSMRVKITIPGEHNVTNALAATGVGLKLGLTLDEIKAGIESAKTIAGRTNVIVHKGMHIIDDCYNANPISMAAAIEVLAHAKGRTIAVLGDMGELGEDEVALHYGVGVKVGEKGIHTLFAAGTLALEYKKGAQDTNPNCKVYYFATREEMENVLKTYVQEGDSILIKASHFMDFPKVVDVLTQE